MIIHGKDVVDAPLSYQEGIGIPQYINDFHAEKKEAGRPHGLLVFDSMRRIRFLDEEGKRLLLLIKGNEKSECIPDMLWVHCAEMIDRIRTVPTYLGFYQFNRVFIDPLWIQGIAVPQKRPLAPIFLFLTLK